MKQLPPLDYLRECFEYHSDGFLIWKKRPEYHFSSVGNARKVNKRMTGKVAGTFVGRYVIVSIDQVLYCVHRIIWFLHTGIDIPDFEIDHRDNNTKNNRFENFRLADRFQQTHNRLAGKSFSNIKGVNWHKRIKKWQARVGFQNKRFHLGYFETKKQAETACKNFRPFVHGEFTNHGERQTGGPEFPPPVVIPE